MQRLLEGEGFEELAAGASVGGVAGAAGRMLNEPEAGIGLQACRLLVADACMGGSEAQPAVFEAGTPWWRS